MNDKHWVRAHRRANGSWVRGHYRSNRTVQAVPASTGAGILLLGLLVLLLLQH